MVYVCAVCSALVTTMIALPVWRAWCLRHGYVDDPGPRKVHRTAIPLAGGLAVFTGLVVPLVAGGIWLALGGAPGLDTHATELLQWGWSRRAGQLGVIAAGAAAMLYLGWLDDRHELTAGKKFAGQLLIALATAAAGVRVTLFVPSIVFSYLVTVLWILSVTNAMNFTDNMNGLCGGLAALAAVSFALWASENGQYLAGGLAWLTVGALLGFLPYNFPRARVFLGDSGSHLLGYLLAVLAVLPDFYSPGHPRILAVLVPVLALFVPLADLVSVVIIRTRRGQPFYVGDTNHFSHRLVRQGYSETQAVLILWLLAAVLIAAGLAAL